ncbi:MAG: hypothetical protein M0R21_03595 [Lentimicrobiaceae bacterium]|nr:hypothetical protein [Lentimicrobiaceae bacterium]
MKKIFTTLSLLLFVFFAFSQITINADDMPNVGDTIRTSISYTVTGNYSLSGANQTWDFSDLYAFTQNVDTFASVSSTPFIYQLVFVYPLYATIAKKRPGMDTISGVTITDVYDFYKEASSSFGLAGYAGSLNGIPIPLKFDTPEILYKFPLTYGTKDSTISTASQGLTGMGSYTSIHKRVNEVDGWGNLITPFGTYPVIRVKSEVFTYDSAYIDSLQMGYPLNRHYFEYKWMADSRGIPILQITQEGFVVSATYIDSVRSLLSVPAVVSSEMTRFSVSPNPAKDMLALNFYIPEAPLTSEVVLFSLNGVKAATLFSGKLNPGQFRQNVPLPRERINPGMYLIIARIGSEYRIEKLLIE